MDRNEVERFYQRGARKMPGQAAGPVDANGQDQGGAVPALTRLAAVSRAGGESSGLALPKGGGVMFPVLFPVRSQSIPVSFIVFPVFRVF